VIFTGTLEAYTYTNATLTWLSKQDGEIMNDLKDKYVDLFVKVGSEKELIGASLDVTFSNRTAASIGGEEVLLAHKNTRKHLHPALEKRHEEEQDYYQFLLLGLVKTFVERHKEKGHTYESRRLIFTNSECISSIQILFREELNVIVNMRSSLVTTALPTDLNFFCDVGYTFINNVTQDHVENDNKKEMRVYFNKPLRLRVNFGSLHWTTGTIGELDDKK